MQALMVMIPSKLFFGAHYASVWYDNLILFALLVLLGTTVSAVCSLIGLVMKISPYVPIMAVTWFLCFFSGTFSAQMKLEKIALPPALAQEAAFDLTLFGQHEKAFVFMVFCALILVCSTFLGTQALRRKRLV
jgi:ABC-2 type transport system permease protein